MPQFTLAQAIALREALATGALTVEYEGRRITYRSQAEMMTLLRLIEDDIAEQDGDKRPRVVRIASSKGL